MRTLTLLLSLLWAATAMGAPARVAVLPVEAPDDGTALQLQKALRDGIAVNPALEDAGPVGMTLDEARMSFSCFDGAAPCMSEVGALLKVDRLLWGRLTQQGGAWVFELHLVDVPGKKAARTGRYADVKPDQVEHLSRLAKAFAAGQAPPPVVRLPLVVTSTPAGAIVRVDGRKLGRTPLEVPVEPGVHAVGVAHTGFVADERMVRVEDKPVSVAVTLKPDSVAQAAAAAPAVKRGLSTRTWWAIGLGGVAAAAGGVAIVMGVEAENLADEAKRIPPGEEYIAAYREKQDDFDRTKLISNVGWITAGAAVVGAVTLLSLDVLDPEDGHAVLVPTGNGLGLAGRF